MLGSLQGYIELGTQSMREHCRMNRGGASVGFIPAETLVQNVTAGDNGTAGGTLNQSVLGFLVG